jgi:hypothetical protein
MSFTATPLDGSSPTPIPMPSVVPDGAGTVVALEGGPVYSGDVSGNKAPVSVWTKDGNFVTFGAEADTAATTDTGTFTFMAFFKRLLQGITTGNANTATIVPGIQGWIAASGTGTATTDDAITFANQVRKVVLYNAATVPVPFEFDAVAAATSFPIQPGQYMVFDDVLCTAVHVFPSATLPINTTAGLYVKGWK